jgi:Endoribonuclease GhoS
MSAVIARVELHSATLADYNELHSYLEEEGFTRVVRADGGTWYQLPTGVYVHQFAVSLTHAENNAVRAAKRTGKRSAVFVVGWDGVWLGDGLAPAN